MLSQRRDIFLLISFVISVHSYGFDPSCFESSSSKKADDCCLLPKFYNTQMVADCLNATIGSTDSVEQYKCLVECIARRLNVFKGSGLDREASLRLYSERIGSSPLLVPVMGDIFEKCFNDLSGHVLYEQSNPPKCSVQPMLLLNCVQTRLFQNCPAKLWQGGAECDELKRKLARGCPFVAIASF